MDPVNIIEYLENI